MTESKRVSLELVFVSAVHVTFHGVCLLFALCNERCVYYHIIRSLQSMNVFIFLYTGPKHIFKRFYINLDMLNNIVLPTWSTRKI